VASRPAGKLGPTRTRAVFSGHPGTDFPTYTRPGRCSSISSSSRSSSPIILPTEEHTC